MRDTACLDGRDVEKCGEAVISSDSRDAIMLEFTGSPESQRDI